MNNKYGAKIVHLLPDRVRLSFSEPIPSHTRELIQHYSDNQCNQINIRTCNLWRGLVIYSSSQEKILDLDAATQLLETLFGSQPLQVIKPAPTELEKFFEKSRMFSIKMLLVLAVAGWILPLMPGTPFLILAWSLGWRPEKKEL